MELSFEGILVSSIRHWKRLLALLGVVAAGAVVVVLLVPNWYTSRTSFAPEATSRSGLSTLAGLAAVAGVQLTGADLARSPDFYADLLRSRPVLYGVLKTPVWTGRSSSDSVTLLGLLRPRGDTEAERLFNAARRVREKHLNVRVERRTNVVEVRFTHRNPAIAAAVANEFVRQLDLFNHSARQTQARARRMFIEAQVGQAETALRSAEEDVRRFLEHNRQFRDSPQLSFEESRLQRRLQVQQDLYLSLRRDLDVARIDEVNDQPTLTVLEVAIPPAKKSGPSRARILIVIVVLSSLVSTLAAWAWDRRADLLGRDGELGTALRSLGIRVPSPARDE